MDALLLAAGFGTRMRPLTEQIPKPLLPIYGVPLIDIHLANLHAHEGLASISHVTVNGHHLAEQVRDHLDAHRSGERIGFSYEPEILGTGGAIAHAAQSLVSEPFLVLNCDTLFVPPIGEAVSFHTAHDYTATLVLVRSQVRPNVLVDGTKVTAILRGRRQPSALTFTGFHVVSRDLLRLIPQGVFHDIRDTYETLIAKAMLGAFVWEGETELPFLDIGTPRAYLEAHRVCSRVGCSRFGFSPDDSKIRYAPGFGYADHTAILGRSCRIEESVVLAGARIEPQARVQGSIVGPGALARGTVTDRLITIAGEQQIRS